MVRREVGLFHSGRNDLGEAIQSVDARRLAGSADPTPAQQFVEQARGGVMPGEVTCPFCNKERRRPDESSYIKWCPNCEMLSCKKYSTYQAFRTCPKCKKSDLKSR